MKVRPADTYHGDTLRATRLGREWGQNVTAGKAHTGDQTWTALYHCVNGLELSCVKIDRGHEADTCHLLPGRSWDSGTSPCDP